MHSHDVLFGAEPVTLAQMLDARERRAAAQREILRRERKPLISFTLNLPGAYKDFPLARDAFHHGKRMIGLVLEAGGYTIFHQSERMDKTGYEAFFTVDAPADALKRLVVPLEERHELGRLFDIDVLDTDGAKMCRQTLGLPGRKCLICDKPALVCIRGHAHSSEELTGRVMKILKDHGDSRFADQVAQAALRALMTEVCITPKPGLVDRANSGAHKNMDIFTFIDSSALLAPYFRRTALCSLRYEGEAERLLGDIRFLGVAAEAEMYGITGGANTHKGAIYTLGILSAAAGYLWGQGEKLTEDGLFMTCSRMIAGEGRGDAAAGTPGKSIRLRYGLTGARGEAAEGMPHVRKALRILKLRLAQGDTLEQAGVAALMHLMAWVDDTNIVARSDLSTLRTLQAEIKEGILGEPDVHSLMEFAKRLDQKLIAQNVSPGGCADLLAAALMIHNILA